MLIPLENWEHDTPPARCSTKKPRILSQNTPKPRIWSSSPGFASRTSPCWRCAEALIPQPPCCRPSHPSRSLRGRPASRRRGRVQLACEKFQDLGGLSSSRMGKIGVVLFGFHFCSERGYPQKEGALLRYVLGCIPLGWRFALLGQNQAA